MGAGPEARKKKKKKKNKTNTRANGLSERGSERIIEGDKNGKDIVEKPIEYLDTKGRREMAGDRKLPKMEGGGTGCGWIGHWNDSLLRFIGTKGGKNGSNEGLCWEQMKSFIRVALST